LTDPHDEMTCSELVALITDFIEGTLPADDRRRFEEHLVGCPHCAAYVNQMRATISTLGELSEESLAPSAREQLLATFRDWKRSG
jgi:anti-sigma factor RsiW